MDACDPDADIENLRKLIKLNTGVNIKLTKDQICQAYQDIQDGKLPLPPLIMNSSRTYLVDKKSPLKPNDYEQLFDATTKRADLKRIARKVGLKNVEQMTKSQVVDAIGKRLRYMKIHEPVKFARKTRVVSVNRNVNTAVNNTAVNNVNTNLNRVNTNVNRVNTTTTNNYKANTTTNYNMGPKVNTTTNYNMGPKVNTTNYNTGTAVNRPKNKNSKVSFPTGGLFAKGEKPKFLGGAVSAVKNNYPKPEKKGFFARLFGKKENKNFIPANKFKNSKPGYAFRKGEEGLGYYKNTGRVEGPQLPPINYTQPIPAIVPKNEDFALELAVARVKQLGLKREQKFLNQIQVGKAKRKDIVAQAEAAKQEENQFASFLDGLDISNTNKNAFKQRMATNDFKQIQVEAQLKADEKANVIRSNEEKMNMFLKTTSLSNVNKTLFLNKARVEGSNINALIEEARKLNSDVKSQKLSNKQDQFRTILKNYNKLNATDKEALVQTVVESANVNTMRKMADDLVKRRMEEKKNATAQNLLSFLTPLGINQKNKNNFLRRFRNENANINSIKTEALKLQESKGSANIENLRTKLNTRLGELGLNQLNQNAIMKKFSNGNRNVNKLIQEAKALKAQKGATNLEEAKKEYRAFINELPGLTNEDKAELTKTNNMNRNQARQMSNKRIKNMKVESKQGFINFMTELGITNKYRDELLGNFNANRMSMDALKNKATKIAQKIRNDKNAELKSQLNARLSEIGLNQINKNTIMKKFTNGNRNVNKLIEEAKALKARKGATNLEEAKKEYRTYINTLPGLTNEDKAELTKTNNMNRNRAKQMSNKRLEQVKINTKQGFINFISGLGITNQYRDELLGNFNANRMTMNALKNKAVRIAQKMKNNKNVELKSQLNTRLTELGLNQINKNTIMKKFTNGNRNVNKLIEEAKALKARKGAKNLEEAKKEYRAFINELPGLTNEDKAELMKTNNMNRNRAKQVSNKRVEQIKINTKQGFINFISGLGITNQYRDELLGNFNANRMTMNALKNKATKIAQKIKNDKNAELKSQLNARLTELGLNQINKNTIMKKFTNGNRNVNKLIQEAKNLKSTRNAENTNAKRQEYRIFLNGLPGLTNDDKKQLMTNGNMNRNRAQQLSNKRLEQVKINTKQGFINFMTELGITNQYRDELLGNFNANRMTMNALKNKATKIAQKIKNDKNAELKSKLEARLTELGLNQINKNSIMKKFTNGNRNVNTLIQQAKNLKSTRNAENMNAKRKEYAEFLNTLPGLTNENRKSLLNSANMNRNAAKQMSNKRLEQAKINSKKGFINFMTELGITNQYRDELLDNFNANRMTMNALKNKAVKVAQKIKNDTNAELKSKLESRLDELGLNQINKNTIMKKFTNGSRNLNGLLQEAKNLKSTRNAENMNAKRKEYAAFLNTLSGLTNENKRSLLNSGNMNRNAAKQMSNKRLEQAKINSKKGFINFMTELGITNQYRDELLDNFNANSMTMNALKNKAVKVAQKIKNDTNAELKLTLNTRLDEIGLNQVNKNSIMKKFNNGNRNVNGLLQEAKTLKSKKNAEIMNAKKKEYLLFLNTLPGLTNDDKQSLLNNMNRNKAVTLSNQRVATQKEKEREQFEKFLNTLGLNNGDRGTMMNKYNSNSLTVNALQKVAQELKNVRVQEQKAANKKTLMNYLETANIPKNTKINIERRFNTNQANLKSLQSEVNKMIKDAQNAKLANNKARLASNVKGSILSNTNKNAFIRRLNAENVNINGLRSELNAMVTKLIETQRSKDRDELEEYMKTQGLSPENQKVVLNKFNVNSTIALTNLKEEANAILASRIQQKRNANAGVLTNHGKRLGLTNQEIKNLTNKLNSEKLVSLMNEASAIANKKAQNEKNALNRAKSDYINKLGLNANNKRNILSQNLNLNATKKLANQRLQNKIAEKRAKNLTKLGLHLNTLNLNNAEKRKFFNNFNRNVNLNTIMKNASNFKAQKRAGIKAEQLANLKQFLNEQGLNAGEQRPFLNKLNKNQDDLAALKVEAKRVADQKFANLKAKKRGELVNVLKNLSNLTQNNINGILKNFDNTNANVGVLSNRAKEINKSRKDEKYAQSEEELYDYLNTLQNLTPENRIEITSMLNGYFTNWNSIKKLATNTAVGRAEQRREAEKADLNNYLSNMGFNNNSKRIFFKNLDDGKNLKVVKKDAAAYKKDLNAKRKATARKGFSNLLDTLYLNQPDRNALLEQFNDDTTGLNQLQNNAREREAKTINRNRGTLTLYLADELKLNTPDVNLLLKNYNADPRSLNTLRNRGRQLKNARNEEERKEIRRQIKEYLNGLNLLNNKNKQNIINKNLPYKNAKNEGNKAQEFKRIAKRGAERNTLTNAIKNLPNSDQKELLNKFNTRNVTLNSMLNEAKDLKVKRVAEKRARERTELYNALNGLNMNVADRNTIMNKFNKSNANVNTLRNEAVKLKNQRVAQKRSQNRNELEAILDGTNLNASNKSSILNKFNANKNATLTSLRATIEQLSNQRRTEKRLATRLEVERYLQKVGLSNANAKTVLNKFNADDRISLKDASNEANAILIQRVTEKMAQNRENLVQYMNGLNITNTNRAAILKNFDSEAANLNTLKNRATQINTAIKAKAAQRKELSNYINGLNINGTNLLNKFNNGSSTLNSLKKDADKRRAEFNARIVNAKREELEKYMNDTFIPKQNRGAFLNRITVNTNMNSIKSNVKNLDNSIRAQKEQEAKNRDAFSVFLNGLELTNKEREDFLKNYNGGKTNRGAIKNKALSINAAVKAKVLQRQELSNYINDLGINGKALLNKFNNGRSTLNSLKKEADKAKALANAKTVANKRQELEKFMNDTFIPKQNRGGFLNRITVNTNMDAIKSNVKNLDDSIRAQKEKEAKNRDDFSVFLNGLELTNKDKGDLLKNYNAGKTNRGTIRNRALSINAGVKAKAAQRQELSNYINGLGINGKELLNKFNSGRSTLDKLKKDADKAKALSNAQTVAGKKAELVEYMKNFEIPKSNKNSFVNTVGLNTNLNTIKRSIKELNKVIKNKKEQEAKNRDAFSVFLNGLELTNKEKSDFLKNYNGGKTNKDTIRNRALSINAAIKAKVLQRQELSNYINDLGINGKALLNKFNNGRSTLESLKKEADKAKALANAKTVANKRQELEKFMNDTLIPKQNRGGFLNRVTVNTNMNAIKSNVKNLDDSIRAQKEKEAKNRDDFSVFLNGLELTNKEKTDLLKNYNAGKTNKGTIRNRALSINAAVKAKALQRQELSNYINGLGINGKALLNKFNSGRSTLDKLKKDADKAKLLLNAQTVAAKKGELVTFMKNFEIPQSNKNSFVNTVGLNTNLNTIKRSIKELNKVIKNKKEKEAKNRDDFSVFLNSLELTNTEKSDLLKNYNAGKTNRGTIRNRALSINAAVKAKAAQRQELSNYINGLGINGKALLNKFNSGRSTLDKLKKDADKAKALLNAQSVATKKSELVTFMKNFNIPQSNKNSFVNTVGLNTNLNTIKRSIKELNKVIKNKKEQEARNRDEFSVFLNSLEVTNKEKSDLLKNYNAGKTNKGTIRNRALSINAAVKAKAAQRQELSNYMNGLGINGKALLNKFNSGRSTLDKLKKEADKAKALLNAKAVNAKKDDLRVYMKNTRLPNTNKQSFLNRVDVNANMNVIKREIKELNKVFKSRNDEFARKKSELSVYLNGLNNLTSDQRTTLLKKVTNANTNIQSLKNEGIALNKDAKNKRAAQAAAEEEKKRQEAEAKRLQDEKKLEKHLLSLKHLTSKEMEGYLSNFKNGKALIDDLIKASKAKDTDNEKDKDAVRNYVRKATIPQNKKDTYLKQLNAPHMNATPIKGLVNANTAAQKVALEKLIRNAEAKLKRVSDITANERGSFKIRLQREPIGDVLKEAEKLGSNRRIAKQAKNKMIKNTARSLQTLTNLTRNNRKIFMNRLNVNGQQKVVTNATALNTERKRVKKEAEVKRLQEQEMKNVAAKLQGLTTLERENRKKFMNRLATNGAQKVLANAAILNKERKTAARRDPLLKRIERNVPRETNFAQARMKWTAAIKGAKDNNELVKIEKLLNDKLKLKARTESEVTNLPSKQKPQYLQNIMAYRNDVADRTQKLNQLIKTKRETKNKATKEVAQKLQSLTKLERTNRTLFMNRVARGENANKVLANADKLQRNRLAAERVKQQKAEQDKKALENKRRREEEEKKRKDQEKAKRDKLRGDTAKMLQGMSGLERKNRQEFMQRLERGNDPSTVISNARARDQMKQKPQSFTFNKRPSGQIKTMTAANRFGNATARAPTQSFTFNKRPSGQIKTMTAANRFGTSMKNRSTTGKSLKQKEADNIRKRREAQQRQRAKSKSGRRR
jgi:hypothetical protein